MAVQSPIMNHQFLSLYIPGSIVDYEKRYQEGVDYLGAVESGDFKETTKDLLSFINTASSNIKLALDKPGKSKRKVNHRKYLQKQIKRCTGLMGSGNINQGSPKRSPTSPGNSSMTPSGFPWKPPTKRDSTQSNLQSKSLAALFDNVKEIRDERCKKVPLRNRNLPPSFFTEPESPCSGLLSNSGVALRDLGKCNQETLELFDFLGSDYNNMSEQEIIQGASVRLHQDVSVEQSLYEPHHLLNGLFYSDMWNPCNQVKKSSVGTGNLGLNETLKSAPLQGALYTNNQDPTMDSTMDESCPSLTTYTPCFPSDCSLPQIFYDYNTQNCNRISYPVM
ncbi:protein FAM181B [Xenopus laevis]|uniref:Protein FAM181B n=2 Tax=Xenopus laevis TaxID=8355 RepID=A0A8J0UQD9_XENLA|nr:protein FAM181B [Xenopus laevis]